MGHRTQIQIQNYSKSEPEVDVVGTVAVPRVGGDDEVDTAADRRLVGKKKGEIDSTCARNEEAYI